MTYKRLLGLCFLMNGICLVGAKGISQFGFGKSFIYILIWMYAAGAVVNMARMLATRKPMNMRNVVIGVVGGLGSVIGMVGSMGALNMLPGYIVFPLSQGGSLLLVVLIGRIFFKEKIGPYGIAGIVAGIAAIVTLSV